jgi:hypothetical protein
MLYISGKNETLKDLKEKEEFEGSLSEYALKFNELNNKLNFKISNSIQTLPPYTPLFPVLQPAPLNPYQIDIARELGNYSFAERHTLQEMQERQIEIPAILASKKVLSDYSSLLPSLRKKLDDPIINTPWKFWDNNFLVGDLPNLISEGLFYKSHSIQRSFLFNGLSQLERDMLTMDVLQMQYHSIRNQKGAKAFAVKQNLQNQIHRLSNEIKQQILPKIQTELSRHLNASYTSEELKKMSRLSFGEKMARKGKMKTTYLDLSNRSSLDHMRKMIPLFKNIGIFAANSSTCVTWASLGYDTVEAAYNEDLEKTIRTGTSGAIGIWTGALVARYIIGLTGTTFIVSTPFGWFVVAVGTTAVANIAGNQVSSTFELVYDVTVDYAKEHPALVDKISRYSNFIYNWVEKIGLDLFEEKINK